MKQVNISQQRKDLDYTDSQKKVLELEKKYMTRLKEIFTGINFNNNMKNCIDLTKNIIIQESSMGTWGKTNPIEIAFERMIHFTIYQEFGEEIIGPYPSPITSDIGVILNDAILNIDAKSNSFTSNKGDLLQLQLKNNQLSFKTKPFGGNIWEFKSYQSPYFEDKPNLTFFLNLAYAQNEKGSTKGFDLLDINQKNKYGIKDMTLVSVPNAEISKLFDFNLAYGFKSYDSIGDILFNFKEQDEKNIILSDNKMKIDSLIKDKFPELYKEKKDLVLEHELVQMTTPKAVFVTKNNDKYKFKKLGKSNGYTIDFCKVEPSTARIKFDVLENRFDHNKDPWKGFEAFDIR